MLNTWWSPIFNVLPFAVILRPNVFKGLWSLKGVGGSIKSVLCYCTFFALKFQGFSASIHSHKIFPLNNWVNRVFGSTVRFEYSLSLEHRHIQKFSGAGKTRMTMKKIISLKNQSCVGWSILHLLSWFLLRYCSHDSAMNVCTGTRRVWI